MAEGTYCDVARAHWDFDTKVCNGPTVHIDNQGKANFSVPPMTASAIHIGAKLINGAPGVIVDVNFSCFNGDTQIGQSVYVVGNHSKIGNWNPSGAKKLDPPSWPTWTGTVKFPTNINVNWKCIIKWEDSSDNVVHWEPGNDNEFTTPSSGSISVIGSF